MNNQTDNTETATVPQPHRKPRNMHQRRWFRMRNFILLACVAVGLAVGYRAIFAQPDSDEGELIHIQPPADSLLGPVANSGGTNNGGDQTFPTTAGNSAAVEPKSESIATLISPQMVAEADHPLDPVLEVACWSMGQIDETVVDYSATITSQVFIDGRLGKERQMEALIRHDRKDGDEQVPFSVYLNFLAPHNLKGQEVIWVDGQNDGKMIAHGAGIFKYKLMSLDPTGPMAMRGSRNPITDIGFRTLISKMYDIGCCDREHDDCTVNVFPGVKIEDRTCTLLEIIHETEKDCFQFHHAKIYIDDERKIPIGYEGYGWPKSPGEAPPLLEKFYYTNINLNIDLTDEDFSPRNRTYHFPRW